jgi:DNA-binding NarL/FixJ family response regulator
MNPEPIKFAIVDDHSLFRNGLAALMIKFPDLQLVFQASNGEELKEILPQQQLPDIILMDINMPEMNGHQATSWLKKNYPTIKVLALSMFNEEKEVITMLRNGACGYLVKESDPKDLLSAIKTVHEDGFYFN